MHRGAKIGVVCLLLVSVCCGTVLAQRIDVIQRRQSDQKRARELTKELLATILADHLRQLEENGLTDLPLYGDIKAMQGRIDELAADMMPGVIDLLAKAAQGRPEDRNKALQEAQKQMQRILLRLLYERELLRMRRKQAELIERVVEIIKTQRVTRRQTLTLSAAAEQTVLDTLGSQRTVKTLYGEFTKLLTEVSTWPGDVGAAAADARGMLRKAGVAEAIDQAIGDLTATKFPQAAESQKAVIDALETVLGEIQKIIAASAKEPDAAEAVRKLIKKQEEVRQKTRQMPGGDEKQTEQLVNEQADIGKAVWSLAGMIGSRRTTSPLIRRASDASGQARESIFTGEKAKAVDEQGRVIGSLAQLEKEIAKGLTHERDLSAAEYDRLAERLAEAKGRIEKAAGKSSEAVAAAA